MTFTVQQDTDRIVLRSGNDVEVEIYRFGALLNRFAVRCGTRMHNAVAAFDSPQSAQQQITAAFRSAKLSPFVCRLADGSYTFGGQAYRVGKFYLGDCAIHGLLYDAPFAVADVAADDTAAAVRLTYDYCGEDEGYPFAYRIMVQYRLQAGGRLAVSTEIRNSGSRTMPLADGWHPYFAADGAMEDWRLQLNADRRLVFDDRLLPTGGTVGDSRFTQGALLGGTELDNCFVVADYSTAAAVLQGKQIRISIFPDESYPYLQVYTPPQRDCIAIENLSGAPDSFNNGIGLIELAAGQTRRFAAVYCVECTAA